MHSMNQGWDGRRLQTRISLQWTRHRLQVELSYLQTKFIWWTIVFEGQSHLQWHLYLPRISNCVYGIRFASTNFVLSLLSLVNMSFLDLKNYERSKVHSSIWSVHRLEPAFWILNWNNLIYSNIGELLRTIQNLNNLFFFNLFAFNKPFQ